MTGDPPRRWPDDSPEENFEAHRARELARHERWMAEQKLRPLADQLESHGVLRGDGDDWAGRLILPDWWDDIAAPPNPCPWCQRPVPDSPCPECRAGRAGDADPPPLWAWWASLSAEARRGNIAAAYFTDPWSGRYCVIRQERTSFDADGALRTAHPLYFGVAPKGIYWGARRRG